MYQLPTMGMEQGNTLMQNTNERDQKFIFRPPVHFHIDVYLVQPLFFSKFTLSYVSSVLYDLYFEIWCQKTSYCNHTMKTLILG